MIVTSLYDHVPLDHLRFDWVYESDGVEAASGSLDVPPVPAGEHFSITGHILHEIQQLPDEAKVKLHTVQ